MYRSQNDSNHCAINQRNIEVVVIHLKLFFPSEICAHALAFFFFFSRTAITEIVDACTAASKEAATDGAPHFEERSVTFSSVRVILLRRGDWKRLRRAHVTRRWSTRSSVTLPTDSGDLRTANNVCAFSDIIHTFCAAKRPDLMCEATLF